MGTLNKEQQKAASPAGGHHLVLAGAGTGKTTTLLQKVINLIDSETCSADEILLLTFSRRAAEEMRERLARRIGKEKAQLIKAGTFHSFCVSFLREHAREFLSLSGMASFPRVLDEKESAQIIDDIIRENLDKFMGLPVSVITRIALSDFPPAAIEKRIRKLGLDEECKNIRAEFAREKLHRERIDFSDMMDYAIKILSSHDEIRRATRNRYRFILVDEFQDTSKKNFTLLKLLLGSDTGLFAVGDDWQSIYGFRDARVVYVVKMKKYFPGVDIHHLTRNYRSYGEIISVAGAFIRQNRFRTRKKLIACRGRGGSVSLIKVKSSGGEVEALRHLISTSETETAILYRNNWQGERLRQKLADVIGEKPVEFMTMHASKGLEFNRVIIAGVADHVIPDGASDLEEERRLFYVALTRARDELAIITHTDEEGKLPRFGRELKLPGKTVHRMLRKIKALS